MVGAAVLDHDHLVVVGEVARGHVRDEGEARDGAGVVVGREEDAEAGLLCAHGGLDAETSEASTRPRGGSNRAAALGEEGGGEPAPRRGRRGRGPAASPRARWVSTTRWVPSGEHDAHAVAVHAQDRRRPAVHPRREAGVEALAHHEQPGPGGAHDDPPPGRPGEVGGRGPAAGRERDAARRPPRSRAPRAARPPRGGWARAGRRGAAPRRAAAAATRPPRPARSPAAPRRGSRAACPPPRRAAPRRSRRPRPRRGRPRGRSPRRGAPPAGARAGGRPARPGSAGRRPRSGPGRRRTPRYWWPGEALARGEARVHRGLPVAHARPHVGPLPGPLGGLDPGADREPDLPPGGEPHHALGHHPALLDLHRPGEEGDDAHLGRARDGQGEEVRPRRLDHDVERLAEAVPVRRHHERLGRDLDPPHAEQLEAPGVGLEEAPGNGAVRRPCRRARPGARRGPSGRSR